MVTGDVVLRARVSDAHVAAVRWTVEDRTMTTPPPFELVLDVGRLPYETKVQAVACDGARRPLYRQEATLNGGGQHLSLEILSPLNGQTLWGEATVQVRARAPRGDAIDEVAVETGGTPLVLHQDGDVFAATAAFTTEATPLTARVKTQRGIRAERTILVNGRGLLTSADAHVVEQLVHVTRSGRPLEGLTARDFRVGDEKGACDVREARLVREAPLRIGLLIDTSISLLYARQLRQFAAGEFLDTTFQPKDLAFLYRFGPEAWPVVPWTSSREDLRKGVLGLEDDTTPGTVLNEGVLKALYQFQGGGGARALLLVTDGNEYDDDVPFKDVLEYARHSGVAIYALGLPWLSEVKGPEGKIVHRETVDPNRDVLEAFAAATGGQAYVVRRAEDLPEVFRSVEEALRTQYLVSFVSNARPSRSFHPVTVRASKGTVHTAPGFFY